MKTALTTACAVALMLAAGVASAQSTQRASRADADADGRISRAEFLSRLDRMTAADANRDGSITADEHRAARQAQVAQRRAAAFARLDANSDGAISRAEFDARPQRAEGGAHERGGDRQGRRMHRGSEAHAEARGDQAVDIAQVRERMTQAFTRLDKNGDGYLTAEERRDGRTQRGGHRGEMRRPSSAAPVSE